MPPCLCSSHCHPARQWLFKAHFFGAFAVSETRAKGALFSARCTKNATSRRTQQPARLSSSAPFNSPPTLDSRLSTHSSSTLDLDSLSTLETCDPATARVDSEASSSTVALRKAFSMVATIPCRFIVCDPHASSFLILRFGTGDPHRSPSPTRAPSPGHPPAVVPTSESDWLNDRWPQLWPKDGLWLVTMEDLHTHKMFHRSFFPRSNCN